MIDPQYDRLKKNAPLQGDRRVIADRLAARLPAYAATMTR